VTRRIDFGAAMMAVAAFFWHVVLMSGAANDNFMHMSMAQQWLAGDWPVRDFYDNGRFLQYLLSAVAQLTIGDRLLGEAMVVGVAWAISTYLVFVLVRQLTNSRPAAFLAALLLIVAGARGYSYPKGIVYAVAAVLWWVYVRRPRAGTMIVFGVWVAVAYYWRPDHGAFAALGLVLAAVAAHGFRRETVTRVALAAATTLALVIPFWIYVHATVGLPEYLRTTLSSGREEHEAHGQHEWPIVRFAGRVVFAESPDQYAPVVSVRWSAGSDPMARQAVRERYGLTSIEVDGDSERFRLSPRSIPDIARLVREPIVEDTAGIDRSSGTLEPSRWPAEQRRKFEHAWLRLQILPDLDDRARAAEYAVALFLLMPLVLLISSPWIAPRLAPGITPWPLSLFAVFAFVVAFAMLREPFTARVADAVVLCAITCGLCTVWLWRTGSGWQVRAMAAKAVAVVLVLATTASVAVSGQFDHILDGLSGHWTSNPIAGAWASVRPELTASPPLAHYLDRPARVTLTLAAYARGCIPPSDRVLVLWFEPEIPYFSGRLLAQRHFTFPPAWAGLAHEQDATIEKVTRYKPPIAFALASALDRTARAAYPRVVEYVEREYQLAATVESGGENYLIFTRKDRAPVASFGAQGWPCFVKDASPWVRVGVAGLSQQ
jgi:hypothetical protein